MPRTYSKNGCIRCKVRKKKCNEERPTCAACAKWNWTCEYDQERFSKRRLSVVPSIRRSSCSPLSLQVPGIKGHGDSEIECKILQYIPERIKMYYTPTSSSRLTDLRTMFQLMTTNDVLRHAIVACFTVVGTTDALSKLHRIAYGRALQSLRSKVLHNGLDKEERVSVVSSIAFLGKMESFSPNSFADQLEHWVALIPLLDSEKVQETIDQGTIPLNETMLIFESLLYHVATDAMFSRNLDRVWHLWCTHHTYERICALNPAGPNRLSLSPLLAGQYEIHHLAFQITHLLQSHEDSHICPDLADELEARVRRRNTQLDLDFTTTDKCDTTAAYYNTQRNIYQSFCNSLLICITSLRESSRSQSIKMQELVSSGMKHFLWEPSHTDKPIVSRHAGHFLLAAIWSIQVQGCASYDLEQLNFFLREFSGKEKFLDPGHFKRALALFDEAGRLLRRARDSSSDSERGDPPPIPAGLVVLRRGAACLGTGIAREGQVLE